MVANMPAFHPTVMVHCRERGDEVIVGDLSHLHIYEQGGSAQVSVPQQLHLWWGFFCNKTRVCVYLLCWYSWLACTPPRWPRSPMGRLTWSSWSQRYATVTQTPITHDHGSYVWKTRTTFKGDVCYLWLFCRRCVCMTFTLISLTPDPLCISPI